ncbi:MAG TPA: PKD domain-containing protein [Myxococcota bacterium]|nr:PKD domain-containing protein [Myxococcota bacterium]
MRRMLTPFVVCVLAVALTVLAGCPDGGQGSDLDVTALDSLNDAGSDVTVDNGQSCTDQCPEEGARECFEGAHRNCADLDDDGCVEWSMAVDCEAGQVCNLGECVSGCPDQECTAIGAKACDAEGRVIECGDFDSDGCLQWGNPTACQGGLVCARGFCGEDCLNECTTIGAKKCDSNSVVTCGDYNSDGCLEWGDASDCGDQFCSSGKCADDCDNECSTINSRQCEVGGYVICNEYDGDGCLEWGTVLFCGQDQVCNGGFCSEECTSACTVQGARKCDGDAVLTCDDYDEDGCMEWSSPVPCDDGLVCSGGNCANQCSNECTVAKARQCDINSVVTCDDYNSDGCLEWGSPVPCDQGLVCTGGNCALSCSNECVVANSRQCVAGTTKGYRICGDYNSDGCLEWGTATDCEGTLVCSNGNCATTCENECEVPDEKKCVVGNGWQQCRDYNSDGCLEWGTVTYCESWEECLAGLCEQSEPPAVIIIDEIMIDTTSSPDIDSFVELWGPASTDLTGWRLVGVNGSNNAEYQIIELVGSIGSDGRFVVAHPQSAAAIHDAGDQFTADVDYQNGPDSIQLRFGNSIVDAIGYGTFGTGDFFAGETAAVAKPLANHSLARDINHTDTGDNSKDFKELSNPTPGAANQDVNEPPVAALQCPSSGNLGETLTFDGSGSDDPDGSLVSFAFDFGDDSSPVSGLQSTVQHAYSTADTFTVTLTVTDDRGVSDSAACQIVIGDDKAPVVTFIKPANDTQVTQGSVVSVIVNPEAYPGRNVTKVELVADGTPTGLMDDAAPYEFSFTVPSDHPNNTSLMLQAKATDNVGSVGFGTVRLQVRNDLPVADFTAVVSGDKEITMDASSSRDTETAMADLEVRWDFTNDGTWDTAWSTEKVLVHTYPADGQYTIRMEVRDAIGQTASISRTVTLSSLQYIGGTVTTTTWTGTIVVTGDITVPTGETLTVAPGTTVLFTYVDANVDSIGDFDITVNGTLIVDGTEAKPVLFTVYGTDHRHARAWNRIIINGTGSQVRWATFEYGDIAFDVKNALVVEDSQIRNCRNGLFSGGTSAAPNLTRVILRDNTEDGIGMTAGTVTATASVIEDNGGRGVYVNGGTLNLSDSTVSGNGGSGIEYLRSGTGLVTRNSITGNAYEGVRVWTDSTSDPTPVINYNNIVGNSTTGALVVKNVNISTSTDASYYGTSTSLDWTNPSGTEIIRVRVAYSESDSSSDYISGSVRKDSSTGTVIVATSGTANRWFATNGFGATKIVAVVTDYNSSSYSGSISVSAAASVDPGVVREISAVTYSGTIDMRHNYLGVFPNVLDRVTLGSPSSANIQGFVGIPFDQTWTKGVYFGGETITQDTTWLGTVYVTGDLTFSGTSLTVQPGTNILFAPIDQDASGQGDYRLTVTTSTFTVDGSLSTPVLFSTVGNVEKGFQEVRILGGTSDVAGAVFENGYTGLHVEAGTHALTDCTFRKNAFHGLWLKANVSGDSATITGGSASQNRRGVQVESYRSVTIDRMIIENNTEDGLWATTSTNAVAVTNCQIRQNGANGVFLNASNLGISNTNIQYNGQAGLRYKGTSTGSLSFSNVKFNDLPGIVLESSSGNPNPVINSNNIYGNSVKTGMMVGQPALSVTTNASYYGTSWSTVWNTNAGQPITWIRAAYSESDSGSDYISGMVSSSTSGGKVVYSTSGTAPARFINIESQNVSSLAVAVVDYNSSSYSGSMSVDVAIWGVSNVPTVTKATEVVAATDSGTVDCKSNYWGVFPDVQPRFSLGRNDAIDFQSFTGAEYTSAGPLP